MDQSSLPFDDLRATKLRDELEKMHLDNEKIEEQDLSENDSDDLLKSQVHISEQLERTDDLLGAAFEEEDSSSYQLPVPPVKKPEL